MTKSQKAALVKELKNKSILVTGGAGSIGSVLVEKLLEYPVHSVRVLDIDEYALAKLSKRVKDSRLRILLGNILNQDRLDMAGDGIDIVFHAAAIKNIEISEYNPIETIDTNVNGTINVIKMLIKKKPQKFINISTDKAADPSTLYGNTKQLGERLTSWAGYHIKGTKSATVRFGNVIESRGNVFEVWSEEKKNNKPLSITEPSMQRYFIHANEVVDFILNCLLLADTGEIFVPKMKKYNIKKLADNISKSQKIIGLRRGEKLEEILLNADEKASAIEKKDLWIIKPYKV
ncbi:MAG: SDR family NAD(P)-dependent oxidoreductase [Thermoproteota archaeon]